MKALEILLPLVRGAVASGADVEGQNQVEQAARDQLRQRAAERDGQVVQRGCDEKQIAEERVGTAPGAAGEMASIEAARESFVNWRRWRTAGERS